MVATNTYLALLCKNLTDGTLENITPEKALPSRREFFEKRKQGEEALSSFVEDILLPHIAPKGYIHDFITTSNCPNTEGASISECNRIGGAEQAVFRARQDDEDMRLSEFYAPDCLFCKARGAPCVHGATKSFHRYTPIELAPQVEKYERFILELAKMRAEEALITRETNPVVVATVAWSMQDLEQQVFDAQQELAAAVEKHTPCGIVHKRVKGDGSLVDKAAYILAREALIKMNPNYRRELKQRNIDDILGFIASGNMYENAWVGDEAQITLTEPKPAGGVFAFSQFLKTT